MDESIKKDKEEACTKIALIISTLCDKYSLTPLALKLGQTPNYQGGNNYWDGNVYLTIGL